MKTWNLTQLSDLENDVLSRTSTILRRTPHVRKNERTRASFSMVVTVAALAVASFNVGVPVGTSTTIAVPSSLSAEVAHNVATEAPPLEAMFGGRFDESWTADHEQQLLERVLQNRTGDMRDMDELLDVITSNQQDSLDEGSPRLSRTQISELLRRRA